MPEPIEAMHEVTAVVPANPDGLSIGAIPDEVLILVLEAHPSRCEVRAVARRCRAIVEGNFEIRKVDPPDGQAFCVDLEVNRHMTKHLYCAYFGGNSAGEEGGVAGAVTFNNWIPAYYRRLPNASREIRHRIGERDACALWKTLVKVRHERAAQTSPIGPSEGAGAELQTGYLTITEGPRGNACTNTSTFQNERQVIGKLSPYEVELVLQVLDHRRNGAAWRVCMPSA